MAKSISNSDDVIDSRDVIARIDELESERSGLADDVQESEKTLHEKIAKPYAEASDEDIDQHNAHAEEDDYVTKKAALDEWDSDNGDELKALKSLQNEAEGYSDWRHGATLIRDSHFKDYAQELAEEIGAIKSDMSWPYTCIDWDKAAEELQVDYTSVSFDGVDYWVRS